MRLSYFGRNHSLIVCIAFLLITCMAFPIDAYAELALSSNEWGEWSSWQDEVVSGSSDRQVETRDVVDSYTMETWVYSDSSSRSWRGYWPHSTGNTLRNHAVETWPKEWVDSARWVIAANTYYDSPDNDNCDGMVHDATAYVCVHGQGHDYVPFFIVGTNYKKQYRYRDKKVICSNHTWDSGSVTKESTCTTKGTRKYTCTICGETKEETIPLIDHVWDEGVIIKEATSNRSGTIRHTCTICGETKEESYRPESISSVDIDSKTDPGTTTITNNGKSLEDNIVITSNGNILNQGTDYTLSYNHSAVIGEVEVTIEGKKLYTGKTTRKVTLLPKQTSIRTLTIDNNQIVVYWDEQPDPITGYEIEYSKEASFSDALTIKIKDKATANCRITGLRESATYYVRIRTYGKSSGKTYYSGWSSAKTISISISGHSYDLSLATISPISDKTYTGRAIEPEPKIVDGNTTLIRDTDYTVEYKNNVKTGTASVTLTGAGLYYGTVTTTFKIVPKTTSIGKLSHGKTKITVRWKRQSSNCSGYQIRYSKYSDFSNQKTKTITGKKKTSYTLKGLKAGTKYYVSVRTYVKKDGKKYYSAWSRKKSASTDWSRKKLKKECYNGNIYYNEKSVYVYSVPKARVTLKIDGRTYKVKINKNGYARIKLKKNYKIGTKYRLIFKYRGAKYTKKGKVGKSTWVYWKWHASTCPYSTNYVMVTVYGAVKGDKIFVKAGKKTHKIKIPYSGTYTHTFYFKRYLKNYSKLRVKVKNKYNQTLYKYTMW